MVSFKNQLRILNILCSFVLVSVAFALILATKLNEKLECINIYLHGFSILIICISVIGTVGSFNESICLTSWSGYLLLILGIAQQIFCIFVWEKLNNNTAQLRYVDCDHVDGSMEFSKQFDCLLNCLVNFRIDIIVSSTAFFTIVLLQFLLTRVQIESFKEQPEWNPSEIFLT